ncbi:O-methyltransferase [Thelephora terrestris]|uniref:O-methyltransferase n=1 Tax=Thelephora terrestris TaxID=56493 RepID=A0A9P6L2G0_9AGAM|nr:O-methyltransferase [Thelephora terrestris]
MTITKTSPLRRLVDILSDAVTRIDEKYASANLEFPSLDKPFDEDDPACLMLSDSRVVPLSSVIVAAADQLIASARHPMQAVLDIAQSHTISACLNLACETCVTEILREAGPEGLPVKDIAAKNKIHPGKLARALRLLATHHVFVEVSPDVFANNSLSSMLDTGKSTEVLFTQPKAEKFKGVGRSHCAYVELTTGDSMRASALISDTLLDPAVSHSEEPSEAPYLRFSKAKSYFDYLYAPGNEYLKNKFQAAMGTFGTSENSTVVPGGFPWETLPKGTKVVDVGGGVGSACRDIMNKNPLLRFTVQDLPSVTEEAIAYWNHHEPKAITDGQVTIQAHDFFIPQPVKDADVFLLRYLLHDWSNAKAIEILERLREVAVIGKTKVIVVDGLIQYACAVDRKTIRGAEGIVFVGSDEKSGVPAGLLPNLGKAGARNYCLDLTMMAKLNGQERTLGDHIRVMDASGWKIRKIYSPEGRRISHVVAEAV